MLASVHTKDLTHGALGPFKGGLFIGTMVMSLALHMMAFGALRWNAQSMHIAAKVPLRVKLNEKPKEEVVQEPAKPLPPKIPPKVEHAKEPVRKPPKVEAKPVAGLSKESFSEQGTGFVAPAGNTLMMADNGQRLRPDQIESLKEDLSTEPQLIATSVIKPEYTQDAVDAGFEGRVVIDVYIDADGKVVQAELARPVGHRMDERILEMARAVRFIPRKNPVGQPIAGWGQIKVTLSLD